MAIVAAEVTAEIGLRAEMATIRFRLTGRGAFPDLAPEDGELVRAAVTTFVRTVVLAFGYQLCDAARQEQFLFEHIRKYVDERIATVVEYVYRDDVDAER